MIAKTKTYLTEALKCDVIVLATALSPAFRLSIFRAWFPSHYFWAQALLNKHFTQRHADIKAKANVVNSLAYEFDKTRNQAKAIHHHQTVAEVDFLPDASASTHLDELSIYLLGKYKLAASQAGQLLKWWKEHHLEFPVLSSLAKDFLACCSTSASVERCFSAAADICGRDLGRLAVRTIERCVSSHRWLQEGFKADSEFESAQAIVSQLMEDIQESKPKKAVIGDNSSRPLAIE
ncbi:hypothetical protein PCASD_11315 [Puccinia coronata f. sp. avenae]|uniref:HAT C-terminal dimerisation domain-containing protein n=1 Tax=Puccinia coronata f. sp. avenae TaxID=200324 RepID=A0A2N5UJ62_9BASI|nr:hypothetical protein PCASD_11315 [Puccinia coronata f. sp. avenae]